MLKDTRKIVFLGLMTGLSVLLARFFSFRVPLGGVDALRIGFGGLPMVFAGVVFGPLAGGIVGALADIIGYLISPMGAYLPHFTLTSFLTGFIPGLVTKYIFRNSKRLGELLVSIAIGQGITNLFLTPYFLYSLFGQPFMFNFVPRLISFPIQVFLFAYFLKSLLNYWPTSFAKSNNNS